MIGAAWRRLPGRKQLNCGKSASRRESGNPGKNSFLRGKFSRNQKYQRFTGSAGNHAASVNNLNYDKRFRPVSIESRIDNDTLNFVEENLWLLQLKPREKEYDPYENRNINIDSIIRLADSTEAAWDAILSKNIVKWGKATKDCFTAQLEMFPCMANSNLYEYVSRVKDSVYGWKLTGAGGGGYLILISEKTVPYAIRVRCHRADN